MNNSIILTLKSKLDNLAASGITEVEPQRNVIKEELQFYVLNFIYHHTEYSNWTMYGGSSLRVCHGLDRMSVDLDFEVTNVVSETFLKKLKEEMEMYFKNTYGIEQEMLTIKITNGRGLTLRFHIGDKLAINHPSKQIHVKIDLNNFTALKTVTERRPINHDQFSFVIKIYNMSALMASKISAVLSRGQRKVDKDVYEEKGRDIYDLLWYMSKKIIPDLDYLTAKHIDVKNIRALFDRITLQMNKVSDANLKQDLTPLFTNQMYIENWLKNWRENYLHLLSEYKIGTVEKLENIIINKDFSSDNFSFTFRYKTEEGDSVLIIYNISNDWIDFKEGDLSISIDNKIGDMTKFENDGINNKPASRQKKLKQYATLFYQKTENYFKKINRAVLGDSIATKLIRMTADNLNQKEQIVLNNSALLTCELDDLLK